MSEADRLREIRERRAEAQDMNSTRDIRPASYYDLDFLLSLISEQEKDVQRLMKLEIIGQQNADEEGDWRVCFSKNHASLREAIDACPDPAGYLLPVDSAQARISECGVSKVMIIGSQLTEELTALLEAAKNHIMTSAEKREQAISFVYGNLKLSNSRVTREMVAAEVDRLRGASDAD